MLREYLKVRFPLCLQNDKMERSLNACITKGKKTFKKTGCFELSEHSERTFSLPNGNVRNFF